MVDGCGTYLYPITKGIGTQLLPICEKPKVYYPTSVLMLACIRFVLILSTSVDLLGIKRRSLTLVRSSLGMIMPAWFLEIIFLFRSGFTGLQK